MICPGHRSHLDRSFGDWGLLAGNLLGLRSSTLTGSRLFGISRDSAVVIITRCIVSVDMLEIITELDAGMC
jgi:hypothetical protein